MKGAAWADRARAQEWAVYNGLFLSTLDTGIITVALKPIATAFDVTLAVAGLTVTFYLFALIALLIPGGWIGDRFGSERTLAVGFAIFGGASVLCSISTSIAHLIAGRALQGIGAALIQGNALGYIAKQPPERKLHMSTLMTATISIGPILGPSLGGLLMELGGWPWLFIVNIPFCIFGVAVAWRAHTETSPASCTPDPKELTLFGLLTGLAAWLLYALDTGISGRLVSMSLLAIVVTAIVFARYEWQHPFPLIPIAALTFRTPAFVAVGAFIFGCTAGVFFAAAPVLLLREANEGLTIVGLVTSAAPVGLFLGAYGRRQLSTWLTDLSAMQVGSLTMLVALSLFAFLPDLEKVAFASIAALYGIGGGIFQVSNIKSASKITPDRPATSGAILRLFQNVGIALGATFALYVLQHSTRLGENGSSTLLLWGVAATATLSLLIFSAFQRAEHYEA